MFNLSTRGDIFFLVKSFSLIFAKFSLANLRFHSYQKNNWLIYFSFLTNFAGLVWRVFRFSCCLVTVCLHLSMVGLRRCFRHSALDDTVGNYFI